MPVIVIPQHTTTGNHCQWGFTLLEVLVAVLVLVMGLLGYAQIQNLGLQAKQHAYQHNQAALLARDIIDRMHANMQFREAIDSNGDLYWLFVDTYDGLDPKQHSNCYEDKGCSTVEMAENDLYEWRQLLQNVLGSDAKASVCIDATPATEDCEPSPDPDYNVYAVRIIWQSGGQKYSHVVTFQSIANPSFPYSVVP